MYLSLFSAVSETRDGDDDDDDDDDVCLTSYYHLHLKPLRLKTYSTRLEGSRTMAPPGLQILLWRRVTLTFYLLAAT